MMRSFVEQLLIAIWDELEWQRLEMSRRHRFDWTVPLNASGSVYGTIEEKRKHVCQHCGEIHYIVTKKWRPPSVSLTLTKDEKAVLEKRPLKFSKRNGGRLTTVFRKDGSEDTSFDEARDGKHGIKNMKKVMRTYMHQGIRAAEQKKKKIGWF